MGWGARRTGRRDTGISGKVQKCKGAKVKEGEESGGDTLEAAGRCKGEDTGGESY